MGITNSFNVRLCNMLRCFGIVARYTYVLVHDRTQLQGLACSSSNIAKRLALSLSPPPSFYLPSFRKPPPQKWLLFPFSLSGSLVEGGVSDTSHQKEEDEEEKKTFFCIGKMDFLFLLFSSLAGPSFAAARDIANGSSGGRAGEERTDGWMDERGGGKGGDIKLWFGLHLWAYGNVTGG